MKLQSLSILVLSLACAWAPSARAGEPIPVNTEKLLQIVVYDNVAPHRRDSWTIGKFQRDRYLEMESALEDAMKAIKYPGPVKVEQFAANLPASEQRLNIYIYKWQQGMESYGSSFTAEFTMEAVLQVGDREFELGTFSARESHVALGGPEAQDYRPVARRAVEQMIEYYRNAIRKADQKK